MGAGNDKPTREELETLLVPGGAANTLQEMAPANPGGRARRWLIYVLFSSINAAMRERADDHSLSTERTEESSASAVSAVVRPAK